MIKVRLMGTQNDISRFERILRKTAEIELTEFSDIYRNKGTNKYYRAYAEVEMKKTAERK